VVSMPTPAFSTMSQTRSIPPCSAMCRSPCRLGNSRHRPEFQSLWFWKSAQGFLYVARRSHAVRSFWGWLR
jgi:hypothetical protein